MNQNQKVKFCGFQCEKSSCFAAVLIDSLDCSDVEWDDGILASVPATCQHFLLRIADELAILLIHYPIKI